MAVTVIDSIAQTGIDALASSDADFLQIRTEQKSGSRAVAG